MHVFADLQSYICTHEQCRDALKTFSTRKVWAEHEFNEHFTVLRWRCFTCRAIISTPQSFNKHMIECHDIVLTAHRLTAAITEAEEAELTPEFKKHQCALCSQSGWQSRKAYATHVGKHLEEISLACLPRDEVGSSDDDLDTDTSSAETVVLGDHHKRSLSVSYQNLTAVAGEEVEETESLQALSPSSTDPDISKQSPLKPRGNVHRYRRIAPKQNVGGSPMSSPIALPESSYIGDPSATDDWCYAQAREISIIQQGSI